jgi:hypothetical protein
MTLPLSPRRLRLAVGGLVAMGCLQGPRHALADRAEVQWSARPVVGVAQLREEGAIGHESALLGGGALGWNYGLSNRLDLGGELVVVVADKVMFADTTVLVGGGSVVRGALTRQNGSALLLLGPTWRFGVAWVPTVALAAGAGVRYRTQGTMPDLGLSPDDRRASVALDLAVSAKVGFEHRISPNLTVGVYGAALAAWSPSAPSLPAVTLSAGLSYVYYPNVAP